MQYASFFITEFIFEIIKFVYVCKKYLKLNSGIVINIKAIADIKLPLRVLKTY